MKTAEEKWKEFDGHWPVHQYGISDTSRISREAYKSALRKAIEEEIKGFKRKKYKFKNMSAYDAYVVESLEKILRLMENVTPE